MPSPKADARRQARVLACQAAYLLDSRSGGSLREAMDEVRDMGAETIPQRADGQLKSFFADAYDEHLEAADRNLDAVMRTGLEQVDPIERAMLRLAALEMGWRPDTTPAVIINEWLEVSKTLSSQESHAFINAVLEQMRRMLGR